MVIPPGHLSATFASSSLLLFELGSLTLSLLSLVLSRLPSPVGCLGERFIFKKMDKIPPSIKLSCSVFLLSITCSSRLVPPFPSFFCFILYQGKTFQLKHWNMLIGLDHSCKLESRKLQCPFPKKKKRKEKGFFLFFPFEIPNGTRMRHSEASYHLGWRICSALLSSLFHHLHLSSIIMMELVNIEMKLPGIDSRIAEESSVSMTFSSFWGQGAWAGVGGGREGWRLGRDAC